jgi:hypothetical protein
VTDDGLQFKGNKVRQHEGGCTITKVAPEKTGLRLTLRDCWAEGEKQRDRVEFVEIISPTKIKTRHLGNVVWTRCPRRLP